MRIFVASLALSCVIAASASSWGQTAFTGNPGVPWPATDALGRELPLADEVGPPREHRTVAMFYFLWHEKSWSQGPFDVTQILLADPDAIKKPTSPPWGPLHYPHHWGESIFGYYLGDDEAVLRKHAQMLADAGVDVVIFDTSNKVTYRQNYTTLMRVFREMRQAGNYAPQVAFLTPFWDPASTVRELYDQLYSQQEFEDMWFRWDGKPLILADPNSLSPQVDTSKDYRTPTQIAPGKRLGQTWKIERPFGAVFTYFPTFRSTTSSITLSLYRDGPQGERIASQRFVNVFDCGRQVLHLDEAQPAGTYYLEASDAEGPIAWWSTAEDRRPDGTAYVDGQSVTGDRVVGDFPWDEKIDEIRSFFTFRKPQPDYFQGPTGPDQWSWLEIYPQHVFKNSQGEKEQMSVGVAQNAVGDRLGSMSEPDARGRSFHNGKMSTKKDAVLYGYNVIEQWERALQEDPLAIFVTGWNEWIAGRFDEFNHVRTPPMFVDQFDQEHSRDMEPMKGGHGDNYYYQLVSYVRRYKGVPAFAPVMSSAITIDGQFADWQNVSPQFDDTIGDPVHRNHSGWGTAGTYVNDTGRNDLVASKVSYDDQAVYFYVQTREPLTSSSDANWMQLLIDTDTDAKTGWLGYDVIVNQTGVTATSTTLQRNVDHAYRWQDPVTIQYRAAGDQLELAIPRAAIQTTSWPPTLDFKWADNCLQNGEAVELTINGDAAPNDRFNFRAIPEKNKAAKPTK